MINRKRVRTSAVSVNLNNLLSRTSQWNYILNEVYHAMEWFGFADYFKMQHQIVVYINIMQH